MGGERTFLVVGADHKGAPALLAERLQGDAAAALRLLQACRAAGIDQAMALLTCDRCEIWAAVKNAERAAPDLSALLAEAADLPLAAAMPSLHHHIGTPAVRHAFAVAASLESRNVGEGQILGQVEDAHRFAGRIGTMGPALDRILQAAFATARRVRGETAIAAHAVSMAAAAVTLARQVHGGLGQLGGLLIGDGDLGDLLVAQLKEAGLKRWSALHAQAGRAEAWARQNAAHGDALERLADYLPGADVVVTALDATAAVITPPLMERALKARRRRPVLLLDLAVPGDVAPAVNALNNAYLYGFDDLERLAMRGRGTRDAAVAAAEAIVQAATAAFAERPATHPIAPLLEALRRRFEAERQAVLTGMGQADADEVTRHLVNRLLHLPRSALNQADADAALIAAARRLFDLEDEES